LVHVVAEHARLEEAHDPHANVVQHDAEVDEALLVLAVRDGLGVELVAHLAHVALTLGDHRFLGEQGEIEIARRNVRRKGYKMRRWKQKS
jgi:hypothetical protein